MRYGIPSYRLPREVIDHQVAEIEGAGRARSATARPLTPDVRRARSCAPRASRRSSSASVPAGRAWLRIEGGELDGVIEGDRLPAQHQSRLPRSGRQARRRGRRWSGRDRRRAHRRCARSFPASRWRPKKRARSRPPRCASRSTPRARWSGRRRRGRRWSASSRRREMPAANSVQGREELEVAAGEGISFLPSWGPQRILGVGRKVGGIELVRCVRAFDDAGRFNPVFDEATTRRARGRRRHPRDRPGRRTSRSSVPRTASRPRRPAPSRWIPRRSQPPPPASSPAAMAPSRRALLITAAAAGQDSPRAPSTPTCAAMLRSRRDPACHGRAAADGHAIAMTPGCETIARQIPIVPLERRSGITEVELAVHRRAGARSRRAAASTATRIRSTTASCACCVDAASTSVPSTAFASHRWTRSTSIPRSDGCSRRTAARSRHECFLYDGDKCIRCGLCAVRCPTAAITMERFHVRGDREPMR